MSAAASPRVVGPRAMARLRARAERAPRVAVMGEFSAGKSTLVNALLGRPVAPIRVTATQAAPLWISQGKRETAEVVDHDGRRRAVEADRVGAVDATTARLIRLRLPSPSLSGIDVIDTPGLLDPLLATEMLDRATSLADMAIWCTSAVQAWRRSEQAAWSALPERLRRRGVLVVTHVDRLSDADRGRVLARLERETGDRFRERLPVAANRAARTEDGAWEASGAAALVEALRRISAEVEAQLRTPLSRYVLADDAPDDGPGPAGEADADAEPPRAPTPGSLGSSTPRDGSAAAIFEEEAARLPDPASPDDLRALADRTARRAEAVEPGAVWIRLLKAHRFEGADPVRLLRQMRGEVADFAEGNWAIFTAPLEREAGPDPGVRRDETPTGGTRS